MSLSEHEKNEKRAELNEVYRRTYGRIRVDDEMRSRVLREVEKHFDGDEADIHDVKVSRLRRLPVRHAASVAAGIAILAIIIMGSRIGSRHGLVGSFKGDPFSTTQPINAGLITPADSGTNAGTAAGEDESGFISDTDVMINDTDNEGGETGAGNSDTEPSLENNNVQDSSESSYETNQANVSNDRSAAAASESEARKRTEESVSPGTSIHVIVQHDPDDSENKTSEGEVPDSEQKETPSDESDPAVDNTDNRPSMSESINDWSDMTGTTPDDPEPTKPTGLNWDTQTMPGGPQGELTMICSSLEKLSSEMSFQVWSIRQIPFETIKVIYIKDQDVAVIFYVGGEQEVAFMQSGKPLTVNVPKSLSSKTLEIGDLSVELAGNTDGYKMARWQHEGRWMLMNFKNPVTADAICAMIESVG